MKVIAIRKDFRLSDISDEQDVDKIVGKIIVGSESDVQLDLSGCLIDYPATSKLVDTIVKQLSRLPGKKKLEIITDYKLPMSTIANWLFLGSRQLGMELKKGLPYEQLVQVVSEALQRYDIKLKIAIRDNTGNETDGFTIPAS